MDAVQPTICPHCGQMQPPRLADAAAVIDVEVTLDVEAIDALMESLPPPQRHELTAALDIRALMSADIAALIRRHGADVVITTRDLERLGWTQRQVLDHAGAAGELAMEATSAEAEAAA